MVEKMKKLYFLIYHNARRKFLSDLQNLGVVHLETDKSVTSEDINAVRAKVQHLNKALTFLTADKPDMKGITQKKFDADEAELLGLIDNLEESNARIKSHKDALIKDAEILKPWGDFDPAKFDDVAKATGYQTKFYSFSQKSDSRFVNAETDMSDVFIYTIFSDRGVDHCIVMCRDESLFANLNGQEERLPLKSLSAVNEQIADLEEELTMADTERLKLLQYIDWLKNVKAQYEDDICYKMADASLADEVDGKVLFITGWVPLKKLSAVESFLQSQEVAYMTDDPTDEDNVPVLLHNNKYARLFEPVTKMHSLPGYNEIDPTPFFAPFFMAFFGLCLADMGYGLVMLLAVIAGLIVMRNNKALKPVLWLGFWLALSTVICGFLLNVCFGMNINQMSGIPESIRKFVYFPNMNDQMSLAIMLGVIQVVFGYVMQVISKIKFNGIQAGLQPLGTMGIMIGLIIWAIPSFMPDLAIGPIPVGAILGAIPNAPLVGLIILAVGVALVLLFNNIQKSIFIRPVLGLWEMYNIATGLPGDILSYIRLFALGLAGGLLGSAFNQIGGMILGPAPGVVNYIFAVIILVLGHTINFALAALSAFVHPLRLVLLEFYKAYGFVGGGRPFRPFKHTIENNN